MASRHVAQLVCRILECAFAFGLLHLALSLGSFFG